MTLTAEGCCFLAKPESGQVISPPLVGNQPHAPRVISEEEELHVFISCYRFCGATKMKVVLPTPCPTRAWPLHASANGRLRPLGSRRFQRHPQPMATGTHKHRWNGMHMQRHMITKSDSFVKRIRSVGFKTYARGDTVDISFYWLSEALGPHSCAERIDTSY